MTDETDEPLWVCESEPCAVLRDGSRVLLGVAELLDAVIDAGHMVAVVGDDVAIWPALPEDSTFVLESNRLDVQRLLDARDERNRRTLEALGAPDLESVLWHALKHLETP